MKRILKALIFPTLLFFLGLTVITYAVNEEPQITVMICFAVVLIMYLLMTVFVSPWNQGVLQEQEEKKKSW